MNVSRSGAAPSRGMSTPKRDSLAHARAAHAAGDLATAERLYRGRLKTHSRDTSALGLLGTLMVQQGRAAEALAVLSKALALDPTCADALNGRGLALSELGRDREAISCFDRLIALRPDGYLAFNNRGLSWRACGDPERALADFDQAIARAPNFAPAHYNRGLALSRLKRTADAVAAYERAIALDPGNRDALINMGRALSRLYEAEGALRVLTQAVRVAPDHAPAHAALGAALTANHRHDDALAAFDRAVALAPADPDLWAERAGVLRTLDRLDEGLDSCDRALALDPDHPGAWSNRGILLRAMGRPDEALAAFERVVNTDPDRQDDRDGQTISTRSARAIARWNKAVLLRLHGRIAEGDLEAEARWELPEFEHLLGRHPGRFWRPGDALTGRVTIFAEGGHGDLIQCSRFAPLVAAGGAQVTLYAHPGLARLMRGLRGGEGIEVVANSNPPPPCDIHIADMSLPAAFGTTLETIPAACPYLAAPADLIEAWGARLGPRRRPRIGLAWSGNPRLRGDRRRSIPLEMLTPLFDLDADFYAVHKERAEGDEALMAGRIVDIGGPATDFADTAAAVTHLDLVISVDTSIAHLSGALGRPVWILLPNEPEWRWLLHRPDTPWYPTARLFRQARPRDWGGVIAEVREALAGFIASA